MPDEGEQVDGGARTQDTHPGRSARRSYRVEVPEEAALLVVTWLLRAGDRDAALGLLEQIGPYADRLRFGPVPAAVPAHDPAIVWRETAGEVREAVARRRPNERVEAMREALVVWNPFADELLALWLQTVVVDGRVGQHINDRWPNLDDIRIARLQFDSAPHDPAWERTAAPHRL